MGSSNCLSLLAPVLCDILLKVFSLPPRSRYHHITCPIPIHLSLTWLSQARNPPGHDHSCQSLVSAWNILNVTGMSLRHIVGLILLAPGFQLPSTSWDHTHISQFPFRILGDFGILL